jgi:hypothetical protein
MQVNYQSATMVRHKLASTLPPLPTTHPVPPQYKLRPPLPAIPTPQDPLSPPDIAPPPYPCGNGGSSGGSGADVMASGYGSGRYGTHYQPSSNTSASSTDHVYEVPH